MPSPVNHVEVIIIMKKTVVVLMVLTALAVATAFGQTGNPGDAVEKSGSGEINWTSGEVFATGIGVPPAQAVNAAQARAMAQRAAVVVALRNLLEIVKGVRVDSETVVENFMTTSDVIRTRVDGIVRGARVVKTEYMSDGAVEVLVAMPLRGALMDAVVPPSFGRPLASQPPQSVTPSKPALPSSPRRPAEPTKPVAPPPPPAPEKKPEPVRPPIPPAATTPGSTPEPSRLPEPPKPAPPSGGEQTTVFKGGKATGLVIDGRGLGLRPALLPKIIDPQGQEIYVGQVVTRTNAVDQGVAGYARDVNAASNNFRVTDNPAVIRGLRVSGSAKTDVVVSQADAQMLRQLSGKGDFLQYCRVIIVY
jgi:hypothetical protein